MITLYIKERLPWIIIFIIIILFINLLFYLDNGFSGISVGYFNLIVIGLFVCFLIWMYFKEKNQIKNFLGNISENNNYHELKLDNLSPYQIFYLERIIQLLNQRDSLINKIKVKSQEDSEDVLAWVHEMKTPLTALKLMIEQIDDYKMRQKLEKEWARINYLLDQQLHNTRLATIEKDNMYETVILKSIVHKEIREFQSWCMEKGIGFQIEGLDCEVVTDSKWLSFIIRQILSNAIKYSYEHTEVEIFTKRDVNDHILLHVKDKGVGIPKEDLPRIFQKSFTGTVGRESFQSTGMGLYLAENAAEKLGIKILVRSIEKEGTIVTLQFPNKNEYHEIVGR
ncbi:sensor histidine kinase [Ureibacillus sp. MALMAid1270]|uniref:sensor histidine kinase n=1 Tax=Ureibacillus sp. MALMAid1270 TaxID=3411629 RepID=UPI003BA6371E